MRSSQDANAVPVEVAPVEHGTILLRRVFSGSLEASASTTLAFKTNGRIERLPVDIGDRVERGAVVATLVPDELKQQVAQAEAELAVVKAELIEAESRATINQREYERVLTLHDEAFISDSELDTVRAAMLSSDAGVEVARARVQGAESRLESARIRLGYATIHANWEAEGDSRVVAERYVEQGETVATGDPIMTIVQLDPVEAVISVVQQDYALIDPGQRVTVRVDAFPGREWEGSVARIAPIFREGSRQARVEISVPNGERLLKPGMFVRVEAVLGEAPDATIVPTLALTKRARQDVVFVVGDDMRARMVPVAVGVRDGDRVQVTGEGVEGRVVTLGQHLLDDGSLITIPEEGP